MANAVRRARAGLNDEGRPLGSFLFLGPTGVGKTELTKALTEFLFGDENALIQLDMSEYSEKHTASRLFGSPPGYVGYEEGGQLTEAVRRKPFSVVLFDEIEKAHADVFNTLLQILEEGRLTDSQGRSVDFRNTVLIMTSNLGTQDLRKANVGFTSDDTAMSYERMKEKVNESLKNHFRPEFLNRIDETIVFHELSRDEVLQTVDLLTQRLVTQLEGQGLGIEIKQAAKELLAELREGRIDVQRVQTDSPSPFASHVLWKQTNELMYADDRPAGLLQLTFIPNLTYVGSCTQIWAMTLSAFHSTNRVTTSPGMKASLPSRSWRRRSTRTTNRVANSLPSSMPAQPTELTIGLVSMQPTPRPKRVIQISAMVAVSKRTLGVTFISPSNRISSPA